MLLEQITIYTRTLCAMKIVNMISSLSPMDFPRHVDKISIDAIFTHIDLSICLIGNDIIRCCLFITLYIMRAATREALSSGKAHNSLLSYRD